MSELQLYEVHFGFGESYKKMAIKKWGCRQSIGYGRAGGTA
jgi:hypothetical protein